MEEHSKSPVTGVGLYRKYLRAWLAPLHLWSKIADQPIAFFESFVQQMHRKFLVLVFFFCLASASAGAGSLTVADGFKNAAYEKSCKVDFNDRFLSATGVKFYRDSTLIAEGDVGSSRLPLTGQNWQDQVERYSGNVEIEYEVRKDGDGDENYVFYVISDYRADGFIVLADVSGRSRIRVYYQDGYAEKRSLNITYFQSFNLNVLLADLACLVSKIGPGVRKPL